jgi:NAD(P)-dependent dehydrogenase (short-subunit alcohol dehydrogenase family)
MLRAVGDLDSQTFLITGANTGIGRATATSLAARGARVFIVGRSEDKTRAVIDEIAAQTGNDQLEFLALDLANLDSVQACAQAFLARGEPLHVLINNAGMAGKRGSTDSGFELAFGVNYVGPYLFTQLLVDRLQESAPARVVNVASEAHYRVDGIDFDAVRQPTKTRTGFHEYSVSKLANVLHAQELARRHHLLAASGRDRVGHLAFGAVADPAADEAAHELHGGRREDFAVLRDVARRRERERRLLRGRPAQGVRPRRDPRARRRTVGAHDRLVRRASLT